MPREGTPGRRSRRVGIWKSSATVADEPDSLSDETLIAYVRGRLPEADAARIAAEATRRPDLAAEIALVRGHCRRRRRGGGRSGSRRARVGAAVAGDSTPNRRGPPAASGRVSGRSRPRPLPPSSSGRWSPCRSSPAPGGEARYAPVSEQAAAGSTVSVAFVPDGERGGDPGAARGGGRADQRRAERNRPLAARLRQRRGPRRGPCPASRPPSSKAPRPTNAGLRR